MDHTWRRCRLTSLWWLPWYSAELQKHNVSARGPKHNWHLMVLTMRKYLVGLWRNWYYMQQHPNAMTQSLLLRLIVRAMGLFSMGMNPSAHFLPTSCRQIFFAFSKTLLPLSHSTHNTNTCSHMPMTQRDGETVCWRKESTSRWIALQEGPDGSP